MSLSQRLGDYPGRGLLVHVDRRGVVGWIYFVTGRSGASRQRMVQQAGNALFIRPSVGNPTDDLRHYACARSFDDRLVVGNGDHVDALASGLQAGETLAAAICSIHPEPDPPIYTPRIAVLLNEDITLLSVRRDGNDVARTCVPVDRQPATSTLIITYAGTREQPEGKAPVQTFADDRTFDEVIDDLWGSLAPELRVLAVAGVGATTSNITVRQ